MAKWFVAAKKADFEALGSQFHIDPVIARIIRNRDIIEEKEFASFLKGTLQDLHSPFLLKDMEEAVAIILKEIEKGSKIRVIGDYDIDGICSAYILKTGLAFLKAKVDTVIPHRVKDGYGLNKKLIQDAAEDGINLIITCDNGISAIEQIDYANELGICVVITDHHEVPFEEDGGRHFILPNAAAVIDPKQEDCSYPFSGICGGVVAYKVVEALLDKKQADKGILRELLELAAFATIGDVMELKDENRIIVKYGLEYMKQSANMGLNALLQVNGIEADKLSSYHVGFVLGPCLNATGRLDTAERALKLLETKDYASATVLAGELKTLNDSRKDMTVKGVERACLLAETKEALKDKVLVLYLPECHESLAGIIAGRVREKYGKPVFILTKSEEGIKGSGRSIESYSMYEAMTCCKECFTKYGGHKMAAGLSMKEEQLEKFRRKINENCRLTDEDFEERVHIDVPMPMSYVTDLLIEQLTVLEPFGTGNPKPLFAQKGLHFLRGSILGKNQNVGKYVVEDEEGKKYELIYFGNLDKFHHNLKEWFSEAAVKKLYGTGGNELILQVAYYPSFNEFRGKKTIQYVMQYYDRG